MNKMYFLIKELIEKHNPDFVVIENVQYQNNFRTYNMLSQMQGIIFALLFELNLGFICIEPTAWKSFCSVQGRKRAEQKASIIQIVKDLYNINATEDEADAIGIGMWAIKNIKSGGAA